MASFFCKTTYQVEISISATLNVLLSAASLLDMGAGPNLTNKDFQPPAWKESIRLIELPQLSSSIRDVLSIEGLGPLFICIGNLRLRAWFEIVEDLATEVFPGTSFTDRCILRIVPIEREIVPWHMKPVANISTKTAIDSVNAYNTVFNVNKNSHDEALSDELCPVARQITKPPHTKAAVLVLCQRAGFMTMEIHGNVVERHCYMTARGLMDILLGKPFHIYNPNVTAKRVIC